MENDKLTVIAECGKVLDELTKERDEIQSRLDDVSSRIEQIQGDTLPTLMLDAGLRDFTLASGKKVKFVTIYKAKIPDEFKSQAFRWLQETGNDAIIKDLVKVQFGMGDIALADECVKFMQEHGANVERDTNVHPRTLESFVKEKMETGSVEFPDEIFGVKKFNRVTLK